MSTAGSDGSPSAGPLAERLARTAADDRLRIVLDVVLEETAALLGQPASAIDPRRAYLDYGYNSLAAVALTEQLSGICGVELPLTLLFDQPNPEAVARYLLTRLGLPAPEPGAEAAAPPPREEAAGEDDAIAVIGMACRFPGGIDSPEGLWELLDDARDVISGFPTDRGWDLDALYHPDPDHPGTSYTRHGGFLRNAADFDHEFFGISPREALAMDPQQRLLLEGAWEVFEDAGVDPVALRGSRTGVFAGISGTDYSYLARASGDSLQGYWGLGTLPAVVSGRVAYSFGFEGPALTVDTACSSSLVAAHLAMRSLRDGECSLALAAGVTVLATPSALVEFSRQRALSPDGYCRSFAASAQGTGFSEGMGVLLLERLSDARRNGHRVHAVLRGSAMNQDGASNGLTAPNGPSQERVIRAALADARLTGTDVDAIEAHGTATVLGDPIEAQALLATYGQDRDADRPLWLGSLKSNIGHTQAAAGVSGVIKMILALRKGVLPTTLHVDAPTPKIDWSSGGLELLTSARKWPHEPGRVRRAGVSSFGASGTNAHVILEEAPEEAPAPPAEDAPELGLVGAVVPWALSGKSEAALRAQAERLSARLWDGTGLPAVDVGRSLAVSRAAFEHRSVVLAPDRDEALPGLGAIASGLPAANVVSGTADLRGRVAFVFPGQGSQWHGMAVELLDSSPVFAARFAEVDAAVRELVDWSVTDVLRGAAGAPSVDLIEILQPVLFAVNVSLAAVWQAAGVTPAAVVGSSQGEIAAAVVAGALSLEDGARIVVRRSRLFAEELVGNGAVASVAAPATTVEEWLGAWDGQLVIAGRNGPSAVTVAGPEAPLAEFVARCRERNVRATVVGSTVASHCAQVDPLRERIMEMFADIAPRRGEVPFYSTVTGGPIDTATLDAEYWFLNARRPVEFEGVVRALLDDGFRFFVESSAHPVLTMAMQSVFEDAGTEAVAVGSLRRDEGGPGRFLTSLAEGHVRGLAVDWDAVFADTGARPVDLPTYAFQRQRFWLDAAPASASDPAGLGLEDAGHPLVAGHVRLAGGLGNLFTGRVSVEAHPWLADHTVFGEVVVPGTALVELAANCGTGLGIPVVEELTLESPLIVRDDGIAVQLQVAEAGADGRAAFTVHAEDGADGWTRHASGVLGAGAEPAGERPPAEWPPRDATPIALRDLYGRMDDLGIGYGPAFRGLRAAWQHQDEVWAEVRLDHGDELADPRYLMHPALLDAAFHAAFAEREGGTMSGSAWLPFTWSGVRLHSGEAAPRALRVHLTPAGTDAMRMTATDGEGRTVASVESVLARPVTAAQLAAARSVTADCLFAVDWTPHAASAAPVPAGTVAVLGAAELEIGGRPVRSHPDLASLLAQTDTAPPAWVLVPVKAPDGASTPEAVRAVAAGVLAHLRDWLAADRPRTTRLAFVTRGAVAALPADEPHLELAPLWGLVRSAQAEHPGAVTLVDLDADAGGTELATALAAGEPQVAVRAGTLLVPRMTRHRAAAPETGIDPEGTILITGGTGGLGALVARHLVTGHGARHLLLASRRGPAADGARALADELTALGAEVRIEACDVSDRAAAAALVSSVGGDHPLKLVLHAAGVMEDSLITDMTGDQLDRVLRAKADSAWHLHELTAGHDLTGFVVFSSLAGAIGGPGQGNYAAANTFIDVLAHRRRAAGLPGLSIGWGLWEESSDMRDQLSRADTARLARSGVVALTAEEGLRLLDATLGAQRPFVLAARLDMAAVRAQTASGMAPALLRGLVQAAPSRTATASSGFVEELAALPAAERDGALLRMVRSEIAAVLQYAGPDAVSPDRAFNELGFDSLGAVQLRNRLNIVTGLSLPVTTIFDHPSPRAVSLLLGEKLFPADGSGQEAAAGAADEQADPAAELDAMDAEDLVRMALRGDAV